MKYLRLGLKYGLISFLILLVFILLVNVWIVQSSKSAIFTEADQVPPAKVALLLGTSRYLGFNIPNAFFFQRIDAAVALYNAGKVDKIIVSGDNSSSIYNETDDMREELVKRGVPDKAIVNDHAGFRTLDSVLRSKSVFDQDEIIVISQRFHLQRALFIARANGIAATGYVAQDPNDKTAMRRIMFREYLARVKAFLDCYILGTKAKFPGPKEPIIFD